MKVLEIRRVVYHIDGTFGVFMHKDTPFALTVEPEWKDNAVRISCIPTGSYLCQRVKSPKFGKTFEITEVPGRTHILIHGGNTEDDTLGCVVVAEKFGKLISGKGKERKVKIAVLQSKSIPKQGYLEFLDILTGDQQFRLNITDHAIPR